MFTSRLELHNSKKVRSLINKKNQILKDKNVKKDAKTNDFVPLHIENFSMSILKFDVKRALEMSTLFCSQGLLF